MSDSRFQKFILLIGVMLFCCAWWLLAGENSQMERTLGPENIQQGSSSVLSESSSYEPELVRRDRKNTNGESLPDLPVQVHFLTSRPSQLEGLVTSLTGMEYRIGDWQTGAGEGVLQLPAGGYKIQLAHGYRARPASFSSPGGVVEITCIQPWDGSVHLNNAGAPVAGATFLAKLSGPSSDWEIVGTTDPYGTVIVSLPMGIVHLAAVVPGEAFKFFLDLDTRKFTRPRLSLSLDQLVETEVVFIDSNSLAPISSAWLGLGPLRIAQADNEGKLYLLTPKGEWPYCFAKAPLYKDKGELANGGGQFENVVAIDLSPKESPTLVVETAEGRAVAGAHVLFSIAPDRIEWEGVTDAKGRIFAPQRLFGAGQILAWHSNYGVARAPILEAIAAGRLTMEETPPLLIERRVRDSNPALQGNITAKAFSLWGEAIKIQFLGNGRIAVPAAVGARLISITYPSGESVLLRRRRDMQGLASLLQPDLLALYTGTISVIEKPSSDVSGLVEGMPPWSRDGDVLEIQLVPRSVTFDNYRNWPKLKGDRPTEVHGWVWADPSEIFSGTVSAAGKFRIPNVPNGEYTVKYRNISRASKSSSIPGENLFHVPGDGDLEIKFDPQPLLDLSIVSGNNMAPVSEGYLEFSEMGYWGPESSTFVPFKSGKFRDFLPAGKKHARLVANGFFPQEIPLDPSDLAATSVKRTILMAPAPAMVLRFPEELEGAGEIKATVDFGLFHPVGGFMVPLASSILNIQNGVAEIIAPFPGCDVWLTIETGQRLEISPREFKFEPGTEQFFQLE